MAIKDKAALDRAQDNPFKDASIAEVLSKNYTGQKPATDKKSTDSAASEENTTVVHIKTIKNEMKYDVTEFEVEAGKPVEIIFPNLDFMQHNQVITKPGEKEKVGLAADKLAADPKGAALDYVPKMPEVLFSSPLLDSEKTVTLRFTAPEEPGTYPHICTFPGHWRIMQGDMKVVKAK